MSAGSSSGLSSRASLAILVLLCAIWGSTWFVIRVGIADVPPFTAAALRFVLAAVTMTLLAPRLARAEGGTRAPLVLAFALGSLNFGISYAAVYVSETQLASGLASVLWSVYPMMTAIATHWFLPSEKLGPRHFIGFGLGLVGVALLFVTDLRSETSGTVGAGLILLVSPLVSTIGTTIVKRRGAGVSSALLNRDAMWIGAAWLALGALAFEREATPVWSPRALFSIVYLALVATALAFGLFFWLLRHESAHRLSLIAYVTPVIALTIGWWLGEEPITSYTLVGAALITLGIILVLRKDRPPARDAPVQSAR